ncbi:MAG: hypothetical protein JW990_18235 [Thermoleophilia bacterium]|nr:hypothetical protein [Thermoleophilia bacterium]
MMANRLTELNVDEVSIVTKGANRKRFLICKSSNKHTDGPPLLRRVKEVLRKAAGNSGPTTEVDDMTAEEIKKAIADGASLALAPVIERIEKLEAVPPVEPAATEPVEKSEPTVTDAPDAAAIAKMVTDGIAAATTPLSERIEKLENVQGMRQSGAEDQGAHQIEKKAGGFWEGSGVLL